MRLLIINNLDSGLGNNPVFAFARIASKFASDIVIRSTNSSGDPRAFLYDADKYDAVICAGGDGTCANIAHMMANTGIPILPYPAGTANLLTLNLMQPTDDPALAKMVEKCQTLDFDIGEIKLDDDTVHGFTIMAGCGYDASIMKDAIPTKKLFGAISYAAAAISNFAPTHSEITLEIDGKKIETSGVGILLINFSKIQFDLSVVHENKPRDGLFDIVVLHTKDAFGLIPALFSAMLDKSGDFPGRSDAFEIYSGSNVKVDANPPLPIQFDGELANANTPFEASIIKSAAKIIVSDEAYKHYLED